MKRKLLQIILAFNLVTCYCLGQITYSNYIDTTSQWNIWLVSGYYDFGCNSFATQYSNITHYISGDTLLGTEWYYKMYSFRKDSTVCQSGTTINSYTQFSAGIREDSLKRIYRNSGFGEALLWDFNISIGDTVKNSCPVSSIDTVWLGNTPLKRFLCNCSPNNIIIEGVGANTGFFDPYFCSIGIESNLSLVCYQKQNKLIQVDSTLQCGLQQTAGIESLSKDNFDIVNVFPNPTENEIILKLIYELADINITIKIINTFGQTLLFTETKNSMNKLDISTLPSGLYFLELTTDKIRITKKIIKI